MTVIKGTFPVRFRVDGKDGEGLWVRYAVTLDKWDATLQKSYPSKMYTLPTDDCIYIGIAVGAGNAPTEAIYYDWLKFVGVDGQSFIIRGVCEEVYNHDAFYDEVEKVVGKVYLLEDYDNDNFNALAVRWTEGGAEDLGAVDGDAYVKSSNKVLFVKNKNRWESLGSIQGPKGDPGKDGEDAVSYKLSSSISALPLNNDGSPQITSFTLSAVMRVGATVVPFDENYILFYYIYHNSDTRPDYKSQWLSSSISSMTVNLTNINDIKNISCSLKYRENNAYKTLDSFDILPIKAGAAGVSYFPNMRGYWELGATYQWQGMSRDMVVWRADGDDKPYLYAVKTARTTVKETLLSPDKNTGETGEWEKAASPFSMLFANFVYTDNASVGGFVYSEEQMRSTSTTDGNKPDETGSNCNILIDGKNGILRANDANISGNITAKSGSVGGFKIVDNHIQSNAQLPISTGSGYEMKPTFKIDGNNGALTCYLAEIYGKIFGTGGKIGGVNLEQDSIYTDYFRVDSEGKLSCSEADVTGKITATSGKIGGVAIGADGSLSTEHFSIDKDGKLSCTDAKISGEITAVSGSIGGINISSAGIAASEDELQTGFALTKDGNLWCNKANISGAITATSGTFDNCTINETCKAGFMKYATNKFIGNVINCGFVNLGGVDYGSVGYDIYLPDVAFGEFMKITFIYAVSTRVVTYDFNVGVSANGRFHDFNNFPIGGSQSYDATITMGRGAYYEFIGMNDGNFTRWICVNKDLPRL